MTLRLSVENSSTSVDVRALAHDGVDPGVDGGRELIELGRAALASRTDPNAALHVAKRLGTDAALTAVEMAAAFQMVNRAMIATGQPAPPRKVEHVAPALRQIGAFEFRHAVNPSRAPRPTTGVIDKLRRRLGR